MERPGGSVECSGTASGAVTPIREVRPEECYTWRNSILLGTDCGGNPEDIFGLGQKDTD